MCAMNFVSHRGIAFILNGRSLIQQVCFFDVNLLCTHSFDDLKTSLLEKCLATKPLRSNNVIEFSCTIKT